MARIANGTAVTISRGASSVEGVIVRDAGGNDYLVKSTGGQLLAVNRRDITIKEPVIEPEVVEDELVEVLNEAGYKTVEGAEEVKAAILDYGELMDKSRNELVEMCKEKDLKATGTKSVLAERLIG